jgi:hypothetical protein
MLNRWTSVAAAAVTCALIAGCSRGIEVRTMTAPAAGLSTLHSFRMLPGPARRDGRPASGEDDPMIDNSIANRALRERITAAFLNRGYVLDERNATFGVAFYATAREKLDVGVWDYGYPFPQGWPYRPPFAQNVTQYTEGSVVIDVVELTSRQLLWRGSAKAELSDDPSENVMQLARAAEAVVARFPQAFRRVVAER